jgi:hypothetical protein|tara:strand:- start:3 stop:659 length:657 start_codon:yes stop_codon:yes gene_type:complete
MFRMNMGSKSQNNSGGHLGGVSRVMSPISALECGTPTTPPCDVERSTGSETYSGEKDGVKGTFTKTSFQTDFKIPGKPGKPGGSTPGTPDKPGGVTPPKGGPGKPFLNPKLPKQTYGEFQKAEYGTPGKTAPKYKPAPTTFGNTKRQSLAFVPDKTPPPPSTPPPSTPPPSTPPKKQLPNFSQPGKGSKRGKIGKIELNLRSGGSKKSGNSCGCAVNN